MSHLNILSVKSQYNRNVSFKITSFILVNGNKKHFTTCSTSPKWLWRNAELEPAPSLSPSQSLSLALSLQINVHQGWGTEWVNVCVAQITKRNLRTESARGGAPHPVTQCSKLDRRNRTWASSLTGPDRSELNYAQRRENFTWTREELFLTLRHGMLELCLSRFNPAMQHVI